MSNLMIAIAGQAGDLMTAMSVLKYRDALWGDSKIVWFAAKENMDLLRWHENLEVREFPRGYGYPEMVEVENKKLVEKGEEPIWENWLTLVTEDNKMNIELKNDYPSLKEFDFGFFAATHQVPIDKRRGVPYPLVSKKVFEIPDEWEWHPLLYFSDDERGKADYFFSQLQKCPTIACETFAGSGQSKITDIQVIDAMDICRRELGKCNFIFTSHKWLNGNETFPEGLINNIDVFSAAHFTVRQTALVTGKCDLMISVSSGTTVAASCWNNPKIPIIQFCGSEICSTKALSNGEFILVTHDGKSLKEAWAEFKMELIKLLNKIK